MAGVAKAAAGTLWQVGPTGFASTSSVSLSQSGAMLTTFSTWPEVSPLVHKRCFVREKNVTWPDSMVLSSACWFI